MMPNKSNSYESVLALVFLLLIIQYFFPHPYLIPLTIGLVLFTLLFRSLADAIHWVWQKLTLTIGGVMSKVLLSIVFFVFLTPLALLYRFFNKKSIHKKASNFVDREHRYEAEDLANPW